MSGRRAERTFYDARVVTWSDRQEYVEAEMARRRRQRDRRYGSFVGATVIMGPVALGFAIADLVHGELPPLDELGFFLVVWGMTFVGLHGWMWEYFTWGRARHSRR
jgi:hypothetical protein